MLCSSIGVFPFSLKTWMVVQWSLSIMDIKCSRITEILVAALLMLLLRFLCRRDACFSVHKSKLFWLQYLLDCWEVYISHYAVQICSYIFLAASQQKKWRWLTNQNPVICDARFGYWITCPVKQGGLHLWFRKLKSLMNLVGKWVRSTCQRNKMETGDAEEEEGGHYHPLLLGLVKQTQLNNGCI